MLPRSYAFLELRFLFFVPRHWNLHPEKSGSKTLPLFLAATYSTLCPTQVERGGEEVTDQPKDSLEALRKGGFSDSDISKIVFRRRFLRNADVTLLQSKLRILSGLGISASDLVKIINRNPRFLSCRLTNSLDERVELFMTLFGSREVLAKAVARNPFLLTYDFHKTVKPAVTLYEEIGVNRRDLIPMLLSRPTMMTRTSFDEEKMEYIRKTGISKDSKMYKHVVALIGISRRETILQKVANLEKFGYTEEEIFRFFGRAPLTMALSIDKVQRNMTFVLGTMKLSASVVLQYPSLLYLNLEAVLKPRALLVKKIQDMGLSTQIKEPMMPTAMRMTEKRFLKVFVECRPKDVADELMNFYRNTKEVKRLAESSKNYNIKFPF